MTGNMVLVEDLAERFGAVPSGDWDANRQPPPSCCRSCTKWASAPTAF